MGYIIEIQGGHEEVALRAYKPHDDSRIRELIRHVSWRVAGKRFTIEQFVQILIEETARFMQNTGCHAVLREGLVTRINEIIDALILDPEDPDKNRDQAEDAKDHFREVRLREL